MLASTTPSVKASVVLPPVLEKIAVCESQNFPMAKNASSTASGRFQFIKSSWEYYGKKLWGDDWIKKDILDWDDNTELALYVYGKNGTKDWLASASCWDS